MPSGVLLSSSREAASFFFQWFFGNRWAVLPWRGKTGPLTWYCAALVATTTHQARDYRLPELVSESANAISYSIHFCNIINVHPNCYLQIIKKKRKEKKETKTSSQSLPKTVIHYDPQVQTFLPPLILHFFFLGSSTHVWNKDTSQS